MSDRANLQSPQDRIDTLERENRRIFQEAQREADAIFAAYQLSQLLATDAPLAEVAPAVVGEIVRLAGAAAAALWLADAGGTGLTLVAATASGGIPAHFADAAAASRWAAAGAGWTVVPLADDGPAGVLMLAAAPNGSLDPAGRRVLELSRHDIGVALRSAQLRDALRRERRELTAIVDGATDSIVQVDAGCAVVRINGAAERLLGITANDAIGRTCGSVLGCEDAGAHADGACPFAEVLATGVPITSRESAVRGAQGLTVRVAGGYSRTRGTATESARATAIVRDISAAKALEELKAGFVATVSHELRTPLALIQGYADTLLHLELDEQAKRSYVERIHQVTGRLSTLVGDILDVTHLDADPLVLERSPVQLGALAARLRGDLWITGGADRLRIDLPADLPPLEVDPRRISQVLENLVSNALKYAPPETPVTIGARVEGAWLVVWVDDLGIGVPEEDRRLVFEPFHRARNVRESNVPGTGLGLHISRRLVEAHGGTIWLDARQDGATGTRATLTLPLLPETRGALTAAASRDGAVRRG
jgi:two-component system phosphate regulon sensor histidine kinase PhoR